MNSEDLITHVMLQRDKSFRRKIGDFCSQRLLLASSSRGGGGGGLLGLAGHVGMLDTASSAAFRRLVEALVDAGDDADGEEELEEEAGGEKEKKEKDDGGGALGDSDRLTPGALRLADTLSAVVISGSNSITSEFRSWAMRMLV